MANETAATTSYDISDRPIKQYTVGEEVFNAVTHGVGALLAIIGGSVIVTLAAVYGGTTEVVACSIYAVSLFIMYTMSTLYHAFPFPKVKTVFRIFDHSSVFLLIAGTYTPFTLISLKGQRSGIIIFSLIWAAAIIGIVLNAINIKKFAKLSLILYLLMGWCIIFVIQDVASAVPKGGIVLLILGGISYTAGVAFYVIKKIKYFHSIWHLFVLAGSILHYLCVAIYVLPHGAA